MTVLFSAGVLLACRSDKDTAGAKAPEPAPVVAPAPAVATDVHLLPVGAPAPDISGKAHDGSDFSLAKLQGKAVIVYFYPKDDTPGCTIEAQDFRDASPDFASVGAVVVGVSMDGPESHRAFAEKHQLNFPLLSDPDGAIAAEFGVSTARGVAQRTTFVIGRDGKIAKVFADVSVKGHSAEVLAAAKQAAGT